MVLPETKLFSENFIEIDYASIRKALRMLMPNGRGRFRSWVEGLDAKVC